MEPEDAELIRAYLDGDTEALARVDDWIRRAAWSFYARLASEWDDLQQDLRLEVTRLLRAGVFRGEARLKTYLWRVVAHACLDRVRKRQRWGYTDLEPVLEGLESEGVEIPEIDQQRVTQDLLRRVWRRAPEDCRHLWSMIIAGFSYAEMSARVGIEAGTLRVRVLRCRKKAQALRLELLEPESRDPL